MDKGKAVLRAVIAQVNLMFTALPSKQSYVIAFECVCVSVSVCHLMVFTIYIPLSLSFSLGV